MLFSLRSSEAENSKHHHETQNTLYREHLERTFGRIHAEVNINTNRIQRTISNTADENQTKVDHKQERTDDGHASKDDVKAINASKAQQIQ